MWGSQLIKKLTEYTAQMRAYEVPEEFIDLISYLVTEVLDGRNKSVTTGVADAPGRKPKDFSQFVKETLAVDVWLVE